MDWRRGASRTSNDPERFLNGSAKTDAQRRMMVGVANQMEGTACPWCGGTAEVLTAHELFGALGAAGDDSRRSGQQAGSPQSGPATVQPQSGQPAGDPQLGRPAGQQPGQPGDEQQAGASSFGPNPYAFEARPPARSRRPARPRTPLRARERDKGSPGAGTATTTTITSTSRAPATGTAAGAAST